ncbi:adhesin [Alkalilimnicola ehrlichii]|uniref:Adhesin n=1 Tax=Alkalilimnicola ehrlichii TaxID=351052 RepID=A0A3E0WGW3_9GAMM|nr:adhesin [Alkalilimnicola ehrlichii]RFA30850.1 adhesin [Alkalilimnicola ehrlichii]
MEHTLARHFSGKRNASQFSVSQGELSRLLQSQEVVGSPVVRSLEGGEGIRYVREVNVGRNVGTDVFNGGEPTSTLTVITDHFGNLVTAFPGVLK